MPFAVADRFLHIHTHTYTHEHDSKHKNVLMPMGSFTYMSGLSIRLWAIVFMGGELPITEAPKQFDVLKERVAQPTETPRRAIFIERKSLVHRTEAKYSATVNEPDV